MRLIRTVVEGARSKYGDDSVCITGHSLGAGVALLVAREFAEKKVQLETHLFNPPFLPLQTIVEKLVIFSSTPLIVLHNWLKEHLSVSQKIELWRSDSMEAIVEAMGAKVDVVGEKFEVLSEWRPHLYLNR
jgi:alpha-beta hydrolase superfamily lysophospholipase